MKIKHLSLTNFRNYENLNVGFSESLNIIYGLNGSGKTNLVEAIYLLALSKSFRINKEKVLIKKDKLKTKIRGDVYKKNDCSSYEIELTHEGKKVLINDQVIDKISNYISRINIILFNPDDVRLVSDAPSERRKFINIEISQLYKEYLVLLNNYNKILKQRNFYLRSMYIKGYHDMDFLNILTSKLIEYGLLINKYRQEFVDNINKYIAEIYKNIFGYGELKVKYNSTFNNHSKDDILKKYQKNLKNELSAGKTLDGIHHDDFIFVLDGNNLKEWGSEGQRKNSIIAFKLAEIKVFNDIKNDYPILILDDLFSELDKEKVKNLLKILDSSVQTFITCTDLRNINKNYYKNAKKIMVCNGILKEEL